MRDLIGIIDQITDLAPDLKGEFASLRSSVIYSAPEMMSERWRTAANILNIVALKHEKKEEIIKIFNGS